MNNRIKSLALMVNLGIYGVAFPLCAAEETTDSKQAAGEETMVVTAEVQNLQAPGVSTITADEIRKRPPARDVSEIIRTMPGVNLTGNSTSGQRGNNRQIDIRGMGPENTLILIDGKPVTSRNSVRLGWRGERDTRGDTSWVPPEMIERIDVIRGPAAARYGNGAAGGVVNIITKKFDNQWHGSWNAYMNMPEHKDEGATKRTDFSLSGPLGGDFSFRMYGNLDKTQADAWDINQGHQSERTGIYADTLPAGREGVENKNINGVVRWDFAPMQSLEFEAGYSRQGNLYAGDTQNTNSNDLVKENYGKETNRLYRNTYSVTWNGGWDNGVTTSNWAQYEHTRNSRKGEGLAGGTEGIFSSNQFSDIDLSDVMLHSEVNIPFDLWVNQNLTLGTEWNQQRMKDNASNTQELSGGEIPGYDSTGRSPYSKAEIFSLFAENNMEVTDTTMLTPALRFDHHSIVGNNWSPSLNLSQGLGDDFTLKMGIARAYKAPSLYQTNPNYILYSKGQGCYASKSGCYLQGNDDLKAETSINKEIGLEFKRDGWLAGVTWFRNDYRNKIEAGYAPVYTNGKGTDLYKWENVPKAVVEGLEGTLNVPVSETVNWTNNITYMLQSKNKETGDRLSIIPEYTLNSTLSWQVYQDVSVQSTFTWYGKQEPKKYNYKGQPVSGSEKNEVSPYSILGLSATWDVTKNVSLTGGVDNVFDKRHWRAGNAQTTGGDKGYMYGAGAETYNESGRTWYMSVNTHF
ncbi:siderophore enterobactin receptor FepA [Klebsiella aerogenes]|uniref:Outer membrane receptor FepA n=1 Tax=Klebsiella aerogenes (strain ATCC 13048 / DSM 30053 / CCUG 1429 / JCM 1235 / KCTC 2190 / NBRC 13534 / NCIMB 10102 / NCTC 10006 / CDC 819-56) TaxID=1028307 RepID=A0A0H3FSK8_KLEAK|nr:siderophore enterobactin receptor FepA [Klebsiella aerogenes]AEG97634.1 outer membrane receptor FepA [Klebsiella aerogenes KCTC 2190]ATY03657.1 TonB-dependent siderophore receptor [Klebsiella aerogenes]EKW1126026.1 siderophore enterobactin receptor FepA [Klebsiella aerogenes]EKW1130905.1 siderophore enterobactin receptor FepA [Klebsiella aerogenes]EKZ6370196.1 siderophore enterobactin receptor FepA [Klebsiella aerogenes]